MRKALFMAMVFLMAAATVRAEEPPKRLITVEGEAEIKVEPDEIVILLQADSEDKDLMRAKAANDGIVRATLELLKKNGVDDRSVQTSRMQIEPRYDYATQRRVFAGYAVSNAITVRLKELEKFDGLLAEVLASGVTRLNGVNFESSRLKEVRNEARLLAVRNSREKAEAMAAALGEKIGRPQSISEQGGAVPVPVFAGARMAMMAEGGGPTIAPGELTIRSSVSVSYELA